MTKQAQSPILVVALLVLGSLGGCGEKKSLGSDNLSPSQACAGRRCGDPCSACSTGSCTTADVVGYCGTNGSCAAAIPVCTPGTGVGGGFGTGGSSAQGGATGSGSGGGVSGAGGRGGTGGVRDGGAFDGPAQCEYQGRLYNLGETRSMGDCNYCVCQNQYGTVQFLCTGKICGTGGAAGTGGASGTGGATAGDAGVGADVGSDGPTAALDGSSTIQVVHLYVNERDSGSVILSRPVQAPISQEDAELVRTESGCGCPGGLVQASSAWTASCCVEYPDCSIEIDRDTGEVHCNLYG